MRVLQICGVDELLLDGSDREATARRRGVTESEQSIYSIGALAHMLGVSPATLRSWEDRYGVVVPERSAGSQRLYSRDQLDQLRFVCQQMRPGLSAADAHRALAERLSAIRSSLPSERQNPASARILLVERDPYAAELAEYFLRTEGYDVHVVTRRCRRRTARARTRPSIWRSLIS